MTSVGSGAFCYCDALERVTLLGEGTQLQNSAFMDCANLRIVDLPDGISAITANAFSGSDAMMLVSHGSAAETAAKAAALPVIYRGDAFEIEDGVLRYYNGIDVDVTIPDTVTTIAATAFAGRADVVSIAIPAGVSEIEEDAFAGCKRLVCIDVDADNADYTSSSGVLYSGDMRALLCLPMGRTDDAFTVPEGVETIEPGAIRDPNGCLSTLELPASLRYISAEGIPLNWPDTVNYTGSRYAWYHWVLSQSEDYPAEPAHLSFGSLASGSAGESADYIVDLDGTMTVTGTGAMTLDENFDPADVRALVIGEGITAISDGALFDADCPISSVQLPESLTAIGDRAFENCGSLETIALPDGVTSLGAYAFAGCAALREITLPAGLTAIGEKARVTSAAVTA